MIFKPLSTGKPGKIYRLLSAAHQSFFKLNPANRKAWQSNWKEYDAEVYQFPDTVGRCGFFSCTHDKVVGFASYDPRGNNRSAIVGHNCILPQFRGQGYGGRQLSELLRTLRERGFRRAVVTTGADEFFVPALRMYRSAGFRETGRKRDRLTGLNLVELEYDLAVNIRKARKGDFNRILKLFKQLWPGKDLKRERQAAVFRAMLESDEYRLLCAERKKRVIGFSSVSIQQNFWQEGRIAYITTLVVDEACRRQGVGSMLISAVRDAAREAGCRKIEMESAFHRRGAHAFYEKMGFGKRAYFFSKDVKN